MLSGSFNFAYCGFRGAEDQLFFFALDIIYYAVEKEIFHFHVNNFLGEEVIDGVIYSNKRN